MNGTIVEKKNNNGVETLEDQSAISSEDLSTQELGSERRLESEEEKNLKDAFGEIKLPSNPETNLLREIEQYKEDTERERKDVKIAPTDDQSATTSSTTSSTTNDDDDDDKKTKPLKYYGYQVPQSAIEKLDGPTKINLEKSEDWLEVWFARLMQKVN